MPCWRKALCLVSSGNGADLSCKTTSPMQTTVKIHQAPAYLWLLSFSWKKVMALRLLFRLQEISGLSTLWSTFVINLCIYNRSGQKRLFPNTQGPFCYLKHERTFKQRYSSKCSGLILSVRQLLVLILSLHTSRENLSFLIVPTPENLSFLIVPKLQLTFQFRLVFSFQFFTFVHLTSGLRRSQ